MESFVHNCSEKLDAENCLRCEEMQTFNFVSAWASGMGLLSRDENDDYLPKLTLECDPWVLQTFVMTWGFLEFFKYLLEERWMNWKES